MTLDLVDLLISDSGTIFLHPIFYALASMGRLAFGRCLKNKISRNEDWSDEPFSIPVGKSNSTDLPQNIYKDFSNIDSIIAIGIKRHIGCIMNSAS